MVLLQKKEEKEFLNLQVDFEVQIQFCFEQRNKEHYEPSHLHTVIAAYIKEKFVDYGFDA